MQLHSRRSRKPTKAERQAHQESMARAFPDTWGKGAYRNTSTGGGFVVLSRHVSYADALQAAQACEDGAVMHVDGAWCAVRLPAGTAAAYNARFEREANRLGWSEED